VIQKSIEGAEDRQKGVRHKRKGSAGGSAVRVNKQCKQRSGGHVSSSQRAGAPANWHDEWQAEVA